MFLYKNKIKISYENFIVKFNSEISYILVFIVIFLFNQTFKN